MSKQVFVCVIFLCNTFIINILQAQHYSFRSYSVEDGLPQSEVWDILSDKRGYLWLGTNGGGLARFNGRHFQVFDKKHGLIDEQVRQLFEDSKGNIWMSTFRGVSKYDGRTFTNYSEKEGVINSVFSRFIEDKKGAIWVYLFQNITTRKLLKFENGKIIDLTSQYAPLFAGGNPIVGLFKDRQGEIYIQTLQKGLFQLQGAEWKQPAWVRHDSLVGRQVTPLLHDSQNRMWFTAVPFNGNANQTELFYTQKDKLQKVQVSLPLGALANLVQVIEDNQQNIWFTTLTTGAVCIKKDGNIVHFTKDNGLTSNFLNGMALDKENNIWFATRGNGIVRFDKGKFIAFNEQDGLSVPFVRSFFEDKNGLMWFGTVGGGISAYNGKELKSFFVKDLNLGRIKCIDTTDAGKLLLTSDVGLVEVEGDSYTPVNARYGLPANAQTSYICKATIKGKKIWFIGTFNQGFYVYNPEKPTETKNYQAGNAVLQSFYIHSIMQDSKGKVWICSNSEVALYENEQLTRYGKEHGLLNQLIIQACEDKWGRLWVTTYGEGIARFDGKRFVHTSPRNSNLSSSVIYSLILDNEGNMWAGTQKGVDKIMFDKNGEIIKIKNYDRYDGFSGLECNGAANYKDRKGNLWFGTIKGALRYNPEEDKPNTTPPVINITRARLFYLDVAWNSATYKPYHAGLSEWFGLPQQLVLPADKNHVTFDFEAISFQVSEKVRYSWKLEGVDADWIPETDKTEASYPNLSAGTYTFWVKAMNNEGVWCVPISYRFVVLPPWYLTWWAITLFVLLIASAIVFGVRWRINALKAYQRHLEKLVSEKTTEVVEQNATLLQQKKEITIQAENLQEANHEITKRQQEMTDSINYAKRIQDAILPQVQHIQELLPESFILFRPRDIVSGDFYWFAEVMPFRNNTFKLQTSPDRQDFELISELTKPKGKVIMAAADCTGHGVPGAFMSMIGNELLHEIVTEKGVTSPDQILYFLHARVRQALKQDETTNRDGMDISICAIDRDRQVIEFAGARSRMMYFQQGELYELKGDKSPIGGEQREFERTFTLHTVSLLAPQTTAVGESQVEADHEQTTLPTTLYMFSDGYIDQFGGKDRKKFRISQLRELLKENQHEDMPTQQKILETSLDNWMNEANEAQIDDVMVIGIRI